MNSLSYAALFMHSILILLMYLWNLLILFNLPVLEFMFVLNTDLKPEL